MGENEKKITSAVGDNKFITISELSRMLKISTTAIENNLSRLKKKGILRRIGPAKGGHWEVVDG